MGGRNTRVRLFSDAGLTDAGATWAAIVLFLHDGMWRLASAKAGRLPHAVGVPAAEQHGLAQAWQLEVSERRRCTASGACAEPAKRRVSRPLAPLEVYRVELLVNLAWSDLAASDAAGRGRAFRP